MTQNTTHEAATLASLRQELDDLLKRSLTDRRVSKAERQQLETLLSGAAVQESTLAELRHRAVQIAKGAVKDDDVRVVQWLGDVLSALSSAAARPRVVSEAHFSPGDTCVRRIAELLTDAKEQLDICVFTITDDRVSDQILAAHRRRVAVRIITDDEKAFDEGSDIDRLRRAGVPVRVDNSVHHMHHKFALFDRRRLLTGSYNWTRAAARDNQENLVITGDPALVEAFASTFEDLWRRFG